MDRQECPSYQELIENLQSVKSKKIGIAFNRTPTLVRMVVENGEFHFLDCAIVSSRRAGVIDHPISSGTAAELRVAQKNHYVIRKLLHPGLIEKKQIAGLRVAAVSAYEFGIETFQRARVGKFRKG